MCPASETIGWEPEMEQQFNGRDDIRLSIEEPLILWYGVVSRQPWKVKKLAVLVCGGVIWGGIST